MSLPLSLNRFINCPTGGLFSIKRTGKKLSEKRGHDGGTMAGEGRGPGEKLHPQKWGEEDTSPSLAATAPQLLYELIKRHQHDYAHKVLSFIIHRTIHQAAARSTQEIKVKPTLQCSLNHNWKVSHRSGGKKETKYWWRKENGGNKSGDPTERPGMLGPSDLFLLILIWRGKANRCILLLLFYKNFQFSCVRNFSETPIRSWNTEGYFPFPPQEPSLWHKENLI